MIKSTAKNKLLKNYFSFLFYFFLAVSLGSCGGGGGGGDSSSPTPSTPYWARAYGGSNSESTHSIQQTSDGGFIVAGETSSFGTNTDVWILKLDANGNVSWQKNYGGNGVDVARSIQQTSDGGFIVAGETSSFGTNTDVWILKLAADGNISWQKTYGGNGDDIAYSIQQTNDGGFIVAGETNSFGAGGTDFWILKLKTNTNGEVEWEKTYGGSGDDIARSIRQTLDGGYIAGGESNSFGGGDKDAWVLKLYSSGGIQWQKTYGENADEDFSYSVQQTSDGGFIIAGETIATGRSDLWVLKLDPLGVIQWQQTYGGGNDESAKSIQKATDGGYIVAGVSSSFSNVFGDIWVLKLDSTGLIQWEKTYGGNVSNSASSIQQTSDGGYIVAGITTSFGAGNADFWALKLDSDGNIGSGCSIISTSTATVTTTSVNDESTSVTAYDTNASVATTTVSPQNTNATTTTQCSFP